MDPARGGTRHGIRRQRPGNKGRRLGRQDPATSRRCRSKRTRRSRGGVGSDSRRMRRSREGTGSGSRRTKRSRGGTGSDARAALGTGSSGGGILGAGARGQELAGARRPREELGAESSWRSRAGESTALGEQRCSKSRGGVARSNRGRAEKTRPRRQLRSWGRLELEQGSRALAMEEGGRERWRRGRQWWPEDGGRSLTNPSSSSDTMLE